MHPEWGIELCKKITLTMFDAENVPMKKSFVARISESTPLFRASRTILSI